MTVEIAPAVIEKHKMLDFAYTYDNIPLHKPYINICKILTSYATIDPEKLRTPWRELPDLRELLTQIGFSILGICILRYTKAMAVIFLGKLY